MEIFLISGYGATTVDRAAANSAAGIRNLISKSAGALLRFAPFLCPQFMVGRTGPLRRAVLLGGIANPVRFATFFKADSQRLVAVNKPQPRD